MSTKSVGGVLLLWLVAALAAGASGVLGQLPMSSLLLVIAGITAAMLILIFAVSPMRRAMRAVPLGFLIACHLSRIAAGLLVRHEYDASRLPQSFAMIAGWGDVIVGIAALLILPIATEREGWRRGAVFGWNLAGLTHTFLALSTGQRLASAVPSSMSAMAKFPVSLLSTFVMPLIIVTHLVIFWRLLTAKNDVVNELNEVDGEWTVIE